MPNQRSPRKVYLGGFIEKPLKKRLARLAREAGMEHNQFGFAVQLIEQQIKGRSGKS